MSGDSAAQGLRSDLDPRPLKPQTLSLDGLVLEVLVARGFNDERVGELAALDDRRRWRCGDDGIVDGTGGSFVKAMLDDNLRGDDSDALANGVGDRLHLVATHRANAQLRRERIGHLDDA
jgi:hypothetical protein